MRHKNLPLFFNRASVAVRCQAASEVCTMKTRHDPAKFCLPVYSGSARIEVELLRPVNLVRHSKRFENNFPFRELPVFWDLKNLLTWNHNKGRGHIWWQTVCGHIICTCYSYKLSPWNWWNCFNGKRWLVFVSIISFMACNEFFLMAERIQRPFLKNQHFFYSNVFYICPHRQHSC